MVGSFIYCYRTMVTGVRSMQCQITVHLASVVEEISLPMPARISLLLQPADCIRSSLISKQANSRLLHLHNNMDCLQNFTLLEMPHQAVGTILFLCRLKDSLVLLQPFLKLHRWH